MMATTHEIKAVKMLESKKPYLSFASRCLSSLACNHHHGNGEGDEEVKNDDNDNNLNGDDDHIMMIVIWS